MQQQRTLPSGPSDSADSEQNSVRLPDTNVCYAPLVQPPGLTKPPPY